MGAILAALLLLPSCGGNRNVLSEPTPPPSQTEGSPEITAAPETTASETTTPETTIPPVDGAPPAIATGEREITGEETLGERLGRLDARMRSAPPDSLPALQAEYQNLLDQATGSGTIETGGPRRDDPRDSSMAVQEPFALPYSPRDGRGNEILITSYDSTLELKGLRSSELRYAAGSSSTVPAAAAEAHESKPRTRTSARRSTATTAAPEQPLPATGTRRGTKNQPGATNFVNGVAATRAGWHAEAVDQLPRTLSTPQNTQRRTLAQYSYAQSLESTGKLSQAADQYLKASRNGTGLGDKSYISYCRVLAKSGQKDRARQLLVQFIGSHPKSDQVVNARQLLQTL